MKIINCNMHFRIFPVIILGILCFSTNLPGQMTVTQHPQPPGYTTLQTNYKNCLEVDQNDNVWMGFRDIGLGKYDGSSWVIFDSLSQGLPSNNILSVGFDINGDVWAGTVQGITRFNGFTWDNFNTLNSGLPENKVTAVSVESSVKWFGTNSGVTSFDGTNWVTYTTSNSGLVNDTIFNIITTPAGTVYFGTLKGVSKFENNTWTTYDSTTSIIPSKKIYDLEHDNYGNIWVASNYLFVITSSGQVLNFIGAIYQEELPAAAYTNSGFAKDTNGKIVFRVVADDNYFFRCDNLYYDMFQIPPYNQGTQALGSCIELDSNNQIWYTSKRDAGNGGSFNSFDLNSYQPVYLPGYGINIDNYKSLDISDVKTLMLNRGDMHWDMSNPKYEVPKGSGKHTVFASALWIGGVDAGGDVHLAAQTYRQTGLDFWPGPISGMSIPFDSASCHNYNKIWKINKWEVEAFKDNYANGNVTNGTYAVPKFFLSWPAKGNNYVTDDKAPFFDNNNNGLYNPYDGDYPLIKGDQMLFWIFNDSLAPHTETNGPKIGLEILASAYAYSCPGIADSNVVMNRTTLYNYRIINQSANDYSNFYTGIWCDNDLGNAVDDYIGCDTTLAAGFVYNGDNMDETSSGYGLNPPMQNVVILKGHLADPGDGVDNDLDGVIDEPAERTTMNHFHTYVGANNTPTANPNGDEDFYNYLQSIWQDGIHVHVGDFGRDLSGDLTNFMYSGTPYGTGWNEASDGNVPEDRRLLLSTGPVTLPAGAEITLDFAYVFTRDSINPNGLSTSVARNIADVQRVHSWFDNDNFPSCLQYVTGIDSDGAIPQPDLLIYPNPVGDVIHFSHTFDERSDLFFSITDITGRKLESGKIDAAFINVARFEAGIYLLTISNSRSRFTGSFVKE